MHCRYEELYYIFTLFHIMLYVCSCKVQPVFISYCHTVWWCDGQWDLHAYFLLDFQSFFMKIKTEHMRYVQSCVCVCARVILLFYLFWMPHMLFYKCDLRPLLANGLVDQSISWSFYLFLVYILYVKYVACIQNIKLVKYFKRDLKQVAIVLILSYIILLI